MAVPEPGSFAPDFELPKDGGGTVRLSNLRGRPVVLYFYPKDDTSGCTTEALDFTARKSDFDALGAVILGVSPDSVKKHDKFKAKHGLTIDLLSDEEKQVVQQYGLWIEKSLYGRKYMGVERSTFLVDPEGKIVTSWIKVKIPGHVDAVLEALKKLLQSVA
jgi:Peroxiredoxin